MGDPDEPFIVVHGFENFKTCPKGRMAWEASADTADYVRKHPICMACGGKLEVKERAKG